jgi:hypothetical protein
MDPVKALFNATKPRISSQITIINTYFFQHFFNEKFGQLK